MSAATKTPGGPSRPAARVEVLPPGAPAHSTRAPLSAEALRQRRFRETHPGAKTESNRRWNESNPAKRHAHKMVEQALRAGVLARQPCERCGKEAGVEAHHDDYHQPLAVMWLCRSHHLERHRELGPDGVPCPEDPSVLPGFRMEKGGQRPGKKLTPADVVRIRADPRGHAEVGRDYGVNRVTVAHIRQRRIWALVP